jgi:hypothetical protein
VPASAAVSTVTEHASRPGSWAEGGEEPAVLGDPDIDGVLVDELRALDVGAQHHGVVPGRGDRDQREPVPVRGLRLEHLALGEQAGEPGGAAERVR